MRKNYLIILLFLNTELFLQAQYNDPYQYYPLATGNYWYYSEGPGTYYSLKIYADSTDNEGNKYFWTGHKTPGDLPPYGLDKNYFVKINPTWGSKASFFYKLNALVGEQWWVKRLNESDTLSGMFGTVEEIYDGYYLGIKTRFKKYVFYNRGKINGVYMDLYSFHEILAYGIGSVYRDRDAYYPYVLLGAIINGKKIGNPVNVDKSVTEELPDDFQLYQNYPNPFNSTTTIKFLLPKSGHIKLTLFNPAGEKIFDIVDDFFNAGTHQLMINLSSKSLCSGVYLCTLGYNNQIKSKKIIYLK